MAETEPTRQASGGLADVPARAQLEGFPPSVKLVALALYRADGPLTNREIMERTLLVERTTRYALNRLEEAALIQARRAPSDPRRRLFRLRE